VTNPYFDNQQQPLQPINEQIVHNVSIVPIQSPLKRLDVPHAIPNTAKRRRYGGRVRGCLLLWLIGTMLMGLTCMGALALYLLFPPPPVDLLIMGLDARGAEGVVTRTDSILVVGIKPAQLDISLLSIPRDLFVDVPGYGMQRINTVNMLAEIDQPGTGSQLLAQSIENNFGIGVDKYVRLDFQAFTALVDAVGGVRINVPNAFTDYEFPTADFGTMEVHFEVGWQQMDGERALIYARTRHADDDYQRAARQQQVLLALAQKLVNPWHWAGAWNALSEHVESNLNILDMLQLSPVVLFGSGAMEQLVINRDYILPAAGYSVPNYALLATWIAEHFD
jgi:LCP family protein required for cell wall assembly